MTTIEFTRNGKSIKARIISRDSDSTCALWAVDVNNPDVDYMVSPSEIVGFWGTVYDRKGEPQQVFIPV